MSKTVDERVVEMRFDNKQFEANVKTSMSTLDKLKSSLKLGDASKGLENIDKASKNISFDTIASGVEALQKRFSTFGIVGMRVIQNITDSMMGLASKTTSFLTDGIIQGGKNRAMNLENAHFQLQGLLKDEEAVAAVMKNVSDSVDGTAYSLDSAAKVASQLAASGMRAGDQMFSSLRAVAGVAAMTNSEYDEIGRIFTKVAGQGRLMGDDLLSLSSRGMNAAATLGTYLHKSEAEVREMVSKGKLDFQTFAAAMDDAFGEHAKKANETFTGALSNIRAALARIGALFISPLVEQNGALVQLFNALRERINDVKNSIGPFADMVTNSVVKIANVLTEKIRNFDLADYTTSFYNVVETLKNIFSGIYSYVKPVGQAFKEVFLTFNSDDIANFSEKIKNLTDKFKLSEDKAKKLKSTFKGLFSILDIGVSIIKNVVSGFGQILSKLSGLGSGFLNISGSLGDWISKLRDSIKENNIFEKAINGVVKVITTAIEKIKEFKQYLSEKLNLFSFDSLTTVLKGIWNLITGIGKAVVQLASTFGHALGNAFKNGNINSLLDILNGGLFTSILLGIKKYISGITEKFDSTATFIDRIKKILGSVEDALKSFQDNLKAGTLIKIATAIGILAASLLVISSIDPNRLTSSLGAITVLFGELVGAMALFNKIASKGNSSIKASASMVGMAFSVLILAKALKQIADLEWSGIAKGLVGVLGLMTIVVSAAKIMSTNTGKIKGGATQMVIMAAALKILASVCRDLSTLKWSELGKGVTGIGAILLEFAGFQALMKKIDPKKMLSSATSLILIASAMEIFADVCSKFGQMQWEELGKAGVAITGILALVTGFSLLAGLAGSMLASSAALLIMATALAIITPVLTTLGGMTLEGIAKGLVAIAGAFVVIGVAGALLGPLVPVILGLSAAIALFGVGCLAVGAGILALSAAFTALATAGAAGATAFVAALTIITVGILQLIPSIVNELTAAIVAICDVIIQSAPAIGEAIKALILTAIDVLVECIPALADGLFKMILGVLDALAEYTPQIVSKIFEILIKVTESAAKALGTIDPMTFLAGVAAITALMLALNAMTALAAGAMVGVLALGAVISELAIVLAAIGALAQIPGLEWLVSEGGDFLQKIGTAIGQFIGGIVGGIVGGIAEGVTSTFPQIATNLSAFMTNLSPFIESAKNLDGSILTNVQTLAETILLLTGAGIIDGITSWLTGGSSLSSFGEQLIPFGEAIKEYGDAVAGINTSGIQQSVDAGKALAELANALPNSGGVAGFFAGENDIDEFGEQLVTFGKSITAYGDAVANINVSGIQTSVTAGKALAELADALPNSGGVAGFFAGNNDMDTFGENLVKFGKSLADFSSTVSGINISGVTSQLKGLTTALTNLGNTGIDGFVKTFTNSGSKVKSAITSMVNNAISAINGSSGKFKSSGTKCMESLISALKSKSTTVTSTCKTALQLAASSIRGYYNSFYNAGSYVASGLTAGIRAGTSNAVAAARSMASQVTAAAKTNLNINSPSKVFMSIGKSVGEGFEKGISDKSQTSRVISSTVGLAGKVISSACDTLGINSPSRAFMAIGRYIGEGLAQGIRDSAWQAVYWTEDTAQKVIAVASKTFEDVEKWVEDAKAFDELSLAEELEIWEAVIEKYGEGTEERTKAEKKAYSVYKELQKENYENSKNWIDAEKEYNRLSLQEELEAWQRVQARYVEGTDERKEADKQVYKLKHELIDDSIEALEQEIANQDVLIASLEEGTVAYANAVKERSHLNDKLLSAKYDNSMNWIDRQDTYNLWDGLADKLAAYTRVLKRHKKGTEEYEKAAKEIYNIEKEIYEARESYNEDVEKIQNEAAEKRIELEEEKADKIKEINEKLQSDIRAADEKYTSKLESRTKSLYDAYGLFDEVKEKETVNSATLIKNLQDQVNEFKDWQKTLDSLSARGLNESLVEELSEMGPSAIAEIKALSLMSDSQLQQYATLWSTKHKQAKNKAVEELEDLRIETNTEIRNLKIQANKDLDEYCNLWNEKMKTLNEDTSEQLDKLRKEFNKKVGLIKSNTEAEIKKMSETAQSIMREAGWDETGQAIVAGMSNGVGTGKTFIDKMKEVAINAVNAVKDVLEIHSPSRVFAELGMFMDEGIVVGLTKYSDRVSQASENVGRESISAISSSISRISDVINSDIAVEPTITPVIDLTNVRNGIGMINGVFGANRSMNLGMAIAANNQNGNSYQSELFGKMQDMAEKANSKLTSAIDSLRSDFNDTTSKLERMQVVLDSGALVGEIAPDMDSALGGLVKMNRRGVR